MTAPRPLPPCPICGREPREWACSDVGAWWVCASCAAREREKKTK